jgi:SAM-dependent methyltransferase
VSDIVASDPDPFPALYAALEGRFLRDLTFPEVRRGLQALSSLYVERRGRMRAGAALEGNGKRAAFALYYGTLHYLLVREIVRSLAPGLRAPRRILDPGCGTGTAGAAWALECPRPASLEGVDASGWAVTQARWTLHALGLSARIRRGEASTASLPRAPAGILAAFAVNELDDAGRARLLARLLEAARAGGTSVLVVEPLSRRVNPWWTEWARKVRSAGGRVDEWHFPAALPETLALLGRGAGLDPRELTARSLCLGVGS